MMKQKTRDDLGLALTALDSDRLRQWAEKLDTHGSDISHWADRRFVSEQLRAVAGRIEATVREVGTLRELAGIQVDAKVELLSRELAEAQQQIATLTSAVAPELATELREWCASVWDGLLDRANLEDSERDSTIEQLAQIVEAHCQAVAVAYVQRAEQAEQQLAEASAEIARQKIYVEKGECELVEVKAENVRLREAIAQREEAAFRAGFLARPGDNWDRVYHTGEAREWRFDANPQGSPAHDLVDDALAAWHVASPSEKEPAK